MSDFEIYCHKDDSYIRVELKMNKQVFEEQIRKGYIDFIDDGTRTIIYLNNYDKVEIYEM